MALGEGPHYPGAQAAAKFAFLPPPLLGILFQPPTLCLMIPSHILVSCRQGALKECERTLISHCNTAKEGEKT